MDNVLDMSVVEELLSFADDGDPELIVDLIRMFLEDGPCKVKAIVEGLEEGDFEKMERAAHSLKGSSGNLGAHFLQESCEQMQVASRQRELDNVTRLTPEISSHYEAAEVALRELLATYTQ